AFTVDRAANLLGTDGPYRAFAGVEIEARLVEFQAEIVEQAPDLALNVVDQPIVNHPVDLAALDGIHQPQPPHVVGIITGHVLHGVAVFQTLAVQLLPVGKAAGQRVAADVDDPGIGQDHAGDAYKDPVGGYRVGEKGLVRHPVDARSPKIIFAKRAKLVGAHAAHVLAEADAPPRSHLRLTLAH